MSVLKNKKMYKKIALALTIVTMILWGVLGTGTSLAWFTDAKPPVKNVFHFADFDLTVTHRLENGTYADIDGQTDIFDRNALYEPGYVQVVYLKIENTGDRAFKCQAAVNVHSFTPGHNRFGGIFNLQDHLQFGAVFGDSYEEVHEQVATRELARSKADRFLGNYDRDIGQLEADGKAGDEIHVALIIYMPESVGNIANYLTGTDQPTVELGITVSATQTKAP